MERLTLARRLARQRSSQTSPPAAGRSRSRDPRADLQADLRDALSKDFGRRLGDGESDPGRLRSAVAEELERLIVARTDLLDEEERTQISTRIIDDVLGYGPLERLLADPDVSEIMVNGTEGIYVERKGMLELTNVRFADDDHLKGVIVRIAASVGRRIDESSPMVDARLADGSRVNAVIRPLAVDGPALTIRKFSADTLTAQNLVDYGSLSPEALGLLTVAVEGRLNVVVSGGTGTGKTTFLNVLSGFIPPQDRIVTIEDAVELQLRQHHVIRLECRAANVEGRGAVGIRELVRNSLRMRPDRIIVGECRGAEAIDMLQAMNTGHDGSLGTLHANTPADALTRLETMVLMSGVELPIGVVREQLASALDVVVQLDRLRTGARVVDAICEVGAFDGTNVELNPLFQRRFDQGDELGRLVPTGARPRFAEKLARHGVELDTSSWAPPAAPVGRQPPPAPRPARPTARTQPIAEPYISPSGSANSSNRSPSGPLKYSDEPPTSA